MYQNCVHISQTGRKFYKSWFFLENVLWNPLEYVKEKGQGGLGETCYVFWTFCWYWSNKGLLWDWEHDHFHSSTASALHSVSKSKMCFHNNEKGFVWSKILHFITLKNPGGSYPLVRRLPAIFEWNSQAKLSCPVQDLVAR